jgi:hypothetical protein
MLSCTILTATLRRVNNRSLPSLSESPSLMMRSCISLSSGEEYTSNKSADGGGCQRPLSSAAALVTRLSASSPASNGIAASTLLTTSASNPRGWGQRVTASHAISAPLHAWPGQSPHGHSTSFHAINGNKWPHTTSPAWSSRSSRPSGDAAGLAPSRAMPSRKSTRSRPSSGGTNSEQYCVIDSHL